MIARRRQTWLEMTCFSGAYARYDLPSFQTVRLPKVARIIGPSLAVVLAIPLLSPLLRGETFGGPTVQVR